jgi:hypothetical protein
MSFEPSSSGRDRMKRGASAKCCSMSFLGGRAGPAAGEATESGVRLVEAMAKGSQEEAEELLVVEGSPRMLDLPAPLFP